MSFSEAQDVKAKELYIKQALEDEEPSWLDDKPAHIRYAVYVLRLATVLTALYFFLVAITLMGDGFKGLTGTTAGSLFGSDQNPVLGLMIGILVTVLVQSSSTTTSIIVVLVANGVIDVAAAIPMIMGSNIGTSVTSTIVSLGFVQDTEAYVRGFAGATVHDMFNYLNVLVLLPTEIIVDFIDEGEGGPLQLLSLQLAKLIQGDQDFSAYDESNPIEALVDPILTMIIETNTAVIEDHAKSFPSIPEDTDNCDDSFTFSTGEVVDECGFSPTCDFCPGGVFNGTVYEAAKEAFDNQRTIDGGWLADYGDTTGGLIAVIISLVLLIGSLTVIVKVLTTFVKGPAKIILSKALNYDFPGGGYVSILVGAIITLFVQSSSITTSLLTPLVAADALTVENMFPFSLGANIGTTGTGLLAAVSSGSILGYQIAFVHMLFNVLGVVIWYPLPMMRRVPIKAAKKLGAAAGQWKSAPLLYLFMAFLIYPILFFALSTGWMADNNTAFIISIIFTVIFISAHIGGYYWFYYKQGYLKVFRLLNIKSEEKDILDNISI